MAKHKKRSLDMTKKANKITCKNCGKKHKVSLSNCCWIECLSCGNRICGRCGSLNVEERETCEIDKDQAYCWFKCNDCGLNRWVTLI